MKILNEDVNNLFFGDFDINKRLTEDIAAVKRQYSYIPEDDFDKIIRLDPTFKEGSNSVGKYGKWLLGLYRKDNPLNYMFISDMLADYDSKKNDRNYNIEKDIGKFKSIADMESAIESATQAELSHRQDVRNRQQARKNADVEKDAELVYEDADWKVYVPKTYEASCKLGQGTRWCTASTESRNYFDEYTSKGPLYININKHDPSEKYQFHFETGQFMDKYDEEIPIDDFLGSSHGLESFYTSEGYTIPLRPDENGLLIYTGEEIQERYRDKVKKIIFENGVTSIGEGAFAYCSELTDIAIPSSVTSIGEDAFYWCSNLTSVTIPSSVTSIGRHAFEDCRSLTSIEIPSSVTSIGEYAFCNCSALTGIAIPSSVGSIDESAFDGCVRLTSITIPSSVTSIGDFAFDKCSGLKSVTFAEGSQCTSIGFRAFHGCNGLTSVTIPSSVTSIGNRAFSECGGLTSIAIHPSVARIGYGAFFGCNSLTIHCKKGSFADEYAQENNISVKYM